MASAAAPPPVEHPNKTTTFIIYTRITPNFCGVVMPGKSFSPQTTEWIGFAMGSASRLDGKYGQGEMKGWCTGGWRNTRNIVDLIIMDGESVGGEPPGSNMWWLQGCDVVTNCVTYLLSHTGNNPSQHSTRLRIYHASVCSLTQFSWTSKPHAQMTFVVSKSPW